MDTGGTATAVIPREGDNDVVNASRTDGENKPVSLGRIAWLVTALACLVAAVVLVFNGYYGYAGVTFAVAVSAAINL